jgi:hypothetical protein
VVLGSAPGGAVGQTLAVGDPLEDYARLLQLTGRVDPGSFTVRPFALFDPTALVGTEGHAWEGRLRIGTLRRGGELVLVVEDPLLRAFANSRFPTGQNDGAVWQGRGITTALDGGATLRWRPVTLQVRPTVVYTQNRSFPLAPVTVSGMPEYAYPWRRIDAPQRFGPDPFWTLDPGQSELRLDYRGGALGVSTTNLWWGPGIRNAIVMSNNAAGFPHAFLGTGRPASIGIGKLELRWIWGRLGQSEWFDPSVVERNRFLTGIVASYSPSFVRGLSLGLTRVFYRLVPDGGVPFADYLAVFQGVRKRALATPENPEGQDEHDQLASIFGRWVLDESGFELYWEWARNDHSWELRDFLMEPEHSQAYLLGLQKAFELPDLRILALRAELTHLERSPTFQVRPNGTYYEHSVVTQGYTHEGQIIGAGVGPGGNAQHIGLDLYDTWGRAGFWLQRDVHDNDAYYAWARANDAGFCCHDVSLRAGAHGLWFVGDVDLGGGLVATREMNRYFFGLDYWNLNVSLSARWRPR